LETSSHGYELVDAGIRVSTRSRRLTGAELGVLAAVAVRGNLVEHLAEHTDLLHTVHVRCRA
jgi:hypothetical protein